MKRDRIVFDHPNGRTALYGTVRQGQDPTAAIERARVFVHRAFRGRPDRADVVASVRIERVS